MVEDQELFDTLKGKVRDCIGETIPMRRRWVSKIMREVAAPLINQVFALTAENERLKGEGKARELLKPFVAHYQPWMDDWADDKECSVYARVTFGDIRRARAAIDATPSKEVL